MCGQLLLIGLSSHPSILSPEETLMRHKSENFTRSFLRSTLLAIATTVALLSLKTADSSASAVEDVVCRTCERAWAGDYNASGTILYLEQYHKIEGSCSGSQVANMSSELPALAIPVQYSELEFDEVNYVEGNCSRCGGTSTCHELWQSGGCHVACGSGGGEVMLEVTDKVHHLFQTADADGLRELIRTTLELVVSESRHAVLLLGCDQAPIEVFELDPDLSRRLESELSRQGD
jgi:hypothetical protein